MRFDIEGYAPGAKEWNFLRRTHPSLSFAEVLANAVQWVRKNKRDLRISRNGRGLAIIQYSEERQILRCFTELGWDMLRRGKQ